MPGEPTIQLKKDLLTVSKFSIRGKTRVSYDYGISRWRKAKALRNKKLNFPKVYDPNLMVYSGEEKAEVFTRSLSNKCAVNLESAYLDFVKSVSDEVPLLLDTPHNPLDPPN